MAKKLGGKAGDTASWVTNIGNEYGQVLMSVLTTHEGEGLEEMVRGVQDRYAAAEVNAPTAVYVDRDCCAPQFRQMIQESWPSTLIRLDIWHFMRRLASAVETESHQLYQPFMAGISQAIFVWDDADLQQLVAAKMGQMQQRGMAISDHQAKRMLDRHELAQHCRRRTRDPEVIVEEVTKLIEAYSGEQGRDTIGTKLLSADVHQIWQQQQRHVPCILDPPGVSLYTEVRRVVKGGVSLPVFRCARGSTSLESFHLHLNRFIPGQFCPLLLVFPFLNSLHTVYQFTVK